MTALALGALSAPAFWLVAWLLLRLGALLRRPGAFAGEALNVPGEQARARLRGIRQSQLLLLFTAVHALVAGAGFWLAGAGVFHSLPRPAVWGLAALLALIWAALLWRLTRAHRAARFESRAHAAVGAALDRLSLHGGQVFHDLLLGGERLDHVVVGKRGLFVVQVAARAPRRSDGAARLHNRHLEFQDGARDVEPVLRAERGARALVAFAARILGHKPAVRAVIAAPGWKVMPVKGGELLLVNEKSAVMLTGWTRPADHLMDEDAQLLQEQLTKFCSSDTL